MGDGGDGERFVEQGEVGVGGSEGVGVGTVGWYEVVDDCRWKGGLGGRGKGKGGKRDATKVRFRFRARPAKEATRGRKNDNDDGCETHSAPSNPKDRT